MTVTLSHHSWSCLVQEVRGDAAEMQRLNIFALHVIGNAAIGSRRLHQVERGEAAIGSRT
jgi:hypothetical protein